MSSVGWDGTAGTAVGVIRNGKGGGPLSVQSHVGRPHWKSDTWRVADAQAVCLRIPPNKSESGFHQRPRVAQHHDALSLRVVGSVLGVGPAGTVITVIRDGIGRVGRPLREQGQVGRPHWEGRAHRVVGPGAVGSRVPSRKSVSGFDKGSDVAACRAALSLRVVSSVRREVPRAAITVISDGKGGDPIREQSHVGRPHWEVRAHCVAGPAAVRFRVPSRKGVACFDKGRRSGITEYRYGRIG